MSEYAKYFDGNNKCMSFLVHNKKILKAYSAIWVPEDNVCCARLSVISLNYVVRVGEKYYSQTFLEECKYAVKNAINEETYIMKKQTYINLMINLVNLMKKIMQIKTAYNFYILAY